MRLLQSAVSGKIKCNNSEHESKSQQNGMPESHPGTAAAMAAERVESKRQLRNAQGGGDEKELAGSYSHAGKGDESAAFNTAGKCARCQENAAEERAVSEGVLGRAYNDEAGD